MWVISVIKNLFVMSPASGPPRGTAGQECFKILVIKTAAGAAAFIRFWCMGYHLSYKESTQLLRSPFKSVMTQKMRTDTPHDCACELGRSSHSILVNRPFSSPASSFLASIRAEMTASEKTSASVSNNVPKGANADETDRY